MQSTNTFDHAADLPAFSFGLDTPNKFLNSTSPTPWSLGGGGLTPSLFSSLNSRGFTPSFTNGGEANPFELSLSGNKRNSAAGPSGLRDGDDFDLFASLGGGRKRALSSPAICTPGGSHFPFLAEGGMGPQGGDLANFAFKPLSKRPRMDSMTSTSNDSVDKIFSDVEKRNDSEASPASSAGFTPPDASIPLPSIKEDAVLAPHDIDVSAPPSLMSQHAPTDPALSYSQHASRPTDLLSQLAQQRSALLASGGANYLQSAPLPMKPLDASAIKPEPMDEQLPASPVAPRPPVTRGQSKKGKGPETSASASQESTASPAPGPKRKGGRKKGSAAPKAAKVAEVEEGEEDEDSLKRRQFLERNRVAACKSRQKKKERVGQLEKLAADLCTRNQNLQQSALALRNEVLGLRQLILQHNGCGCEHAQGYIARDAAGGGIATIDQLAGSTLTLDYSIPPSMGTDDDVYSFLDRDEPGPPPISQVLPPGGVPMVGGAAYPAPLPLAGPAIPLVPASPVRPSASVNASPANMVTGGGNSGIRTRSSALGGGGGGRPLNGATIPVTSLAPSSFAAAVAMPQPILDIQVRSTSAPPITPIWDAPQPSGDYFAPKERIAVA
ncbi:hypothetical protein JCM11251_000602 [Rhodosporidiobolus azoricus]